MVIPTPTKCNHCGNSESPLKRCKGICGGAVAYCNRECQLADYKIHKKNCWKKAASPCFVTPDERAAGRPDIPLRAYHMLDGFGKSGILLHYSNHMGEEFSKFHVKEVLGDYDIKDCNGTHLESIPWEYGTNPVHDDYDRSTLKYGEAVFNIEKIGWATYNSMIKAGIVKDTGKTIQMGMYPYPFPVARINIEIYQRDENED